VTPQLELRRVDLGSLFKVAFVVYAILGLIAGLFYAMIFAALGQFGGMFEDEIPGLGLMSGALGALAVPVLSVLYGILGSVVIVIGGALYNLAAKFMGGVRFDARYHGVTPVNPPVPPVV